MILVWCSIVCCDCLPRVGFAFLVVWLRLWFVVLCVLVLWLFLLFRIPASMPPDPDTCCPVVVCSCVPVVYFNETMNGEPNSEK